MKEFVLTQPYGNLEEMLSSAEVAIYEEELQQGDIEKYAIVSRIGNRYDLKGKKIESYAKNPYFKKKEEIAVKDAKIEIAQDVPVVKEKITEVNGMKYYEVETFIDKEIEKAVADVEYKHAQEIEKMKETHAKELAYVKEQVKAELLAKLNS